MYLQCVFVDELLRKVMRYASDSAPQTLVASTPSGLHKAFDLVFLTFCTCRILVVSLYSKQFSITHKLESIVAFRRP